MEKELNELLEAVREVIQMSHRGGKYFEIEHKHFYELESAYRAAKFWLDRDAAKKAKVKA